MIMHKGNRIKQLARWTNTCYVCIFIVEFEQVIYQRQRNILTWIKVTGKDC